MIDLVEFLRQRLDEDEQAANAAPGSTWIAFPQEDIAGASVYDKQWRLLEPAHYDHDNKLGATTGPRYIENARDQLVTHIARHDPKRVLTEVEAKRRILERHRDYDFLYNPDDGPGDYSWTPYCIRCGEKWPCDTLRDLAAPYADHPDYRQEWKP